MWLSRTRHSRRFEKFFNKFLKHYDKRVQTYLATAGAAVKPGDSSPTQFTTPSKSWPNPAVADLLVTLGTAGINNKQKAVPATGERIQQDLEIVLIT